MEVRNMTKKRIEEGAIFKCGGWKLQIARSRGGNLCVDVENPTVTFSDRSIWYPFNGRVAYDYPEHIPVAVKANVQRIYDRMVEEGLRVPEFNARGRR
jgi:hypothetical protein